MTESNEGFSAIERDWTCANGKSNSSPAFLVLVDEVARLIRGDAHRLLAGDTEGTARLILAQLTHRWGMTLNAESGAK